MKRTLLATALMLGSLSVANAAPIVIDDFSGSTFAGDAPLSGAGAGTSSASYTRTVSATTSGTDTNVQLNTLTNPSVYAHSQSAGVTGTSSVNFSLGGLDLNDGANAFRFALTSADLNGIVGLTVDAVSVSFSTNSILIASGLAFPAYVDFLFSSFAGVNFDSVNNVSIFIDGSSQAALDVSVDNFGTVCSSATTSGGVGTAPAAGNCAPPTNVPEPAMLGLMGLGFAAMGASRRRRQA